MSCLLVLPPPPHSHLYSICSPLCFNRSTLSLSVPTFHLSVNTQSLTAPHSKSLSQLFTSSHPTKFLIQLFTTSQQCLCPIVQNISLLKLFTSSYPSKSLIQLFTTSTKSRSQLFTTTHQSLCPNCSPILTKVSVPTVHQSPLLPKVSVPTVHNFSALSLCPNCSLLLTTQSLCPNCSLLLTTQSLCPNWS